MSSRRATAFELLVLMPNSDAQSEIGLVRRREGAKEPSDLEGFS
jgi:hypothetical protein